MHIAKKQAIPKTASQKYDLITAIGAFALAAGKSEQRLSLRFITLVTARYNWVKNELCVGQREIARLWSVDERTVKREMAKLRAREWLIVKRQGRRGRVTEYGINTTKILETTKSHWDLVGPDFSLRLQGGPDTDTVIPLPLQNTVQAPAVIDGDDWSLAQALLYSEDTAVYGSWIRALEKIDRAGGRLTLRAPSRFHGAYVQTHLIARVFEACRAVDNSIHEVIISD